MRDNLTGKSVMIWKRIRTSNEAISGIFRGGFVLVVLVLSQVVSFGADLVQLMDGSSLQGDFREITTDGRIQFKHRSIEDVFELDAGRVEWMRFDSSPQTENQWDEPTAYFSFINGDHIYGKLHAMDDEIVSISTMTGDMLSAPRNLLQSVTHLPSGYKLLYEGPMGNDTWQMTRRNSSYGSSTGRQVQPGWQFRNGIFMAEGPGILGKSFPLKDTVFIEFDLSWIGFFSLYVGLFSDNSDTYDYRSQSYRLTLSPASAAVQKIQPNMRLFEFGRVRFPDMQEQSKVNLALLVNRIENKITLFRDGKIIREFKEKQNSIPAGNSIVFSSNSTGPYLKLTRLHISTWSGDQPFFIPTQNNADSDIVYLKNSDLVEGTIMNVSSEAVSIVTPFFDADIPSDRIIHYSFSAVDSSLITETGGNPVRTSLYGGGSLAIDLDDWSKGQVKGRSPVFGNLAFKSDLVRQVIFTEANPSDSQFDFGDGFQEVLWDDPEAGVGQQ